jgi:hypothetical protein
VSEPFGWGAPEEPEVALSEPLPHWDEPSDHETSTLAETIGKNVQLFEESKINLDRRQKLHIQMTARGLFTLGQPITGEAIWNLWPLGLGKSGSVSSRITEPEERGKVFRAGFRPTINEIQSFLGSQEYSDAMVELGVEVDPNASGLTVEQLGLLTILSNPADGRDLKRKLSHAGITWNKYQTWREQAVFSKAHDQIVGETLKKMMPMAKQQLAAKIASGDISAIKFGMEVTGEHDPNGKKQIDAKAFIGILLEIIEEEVTDAATLQRIAAKVSLRGAKTIEG